MKTLFWKGACLGWHCWAMGSSGQSASKQVDKYFLNRWKSISWLRFHHFSSKTIWSLISNAKIQACVPLDSKIKLVWWILYYYQPKANLTATESYTDRQAHAVLEVPVPAITTNCLGWKIFLAKYKNMEVLNCHDDWWSQCLMQNIKHCGR